MDTSESVAIENAIDSISDDFPAVPRSRVAELVYAEHRHFAGRPIRDFVPVLVETHVRGQLKGSRRPSLTPAA